MSRLHSLPERIDPQRAAAASELQGELPLEGMARLGERLVSSNGHVSVTLEITRAAHGDDEAPVYVAGGQLEASLELQCQRCLAPMVYDVRQGFDVALVASEATATGLPEEMEIFELDARGELVVRDLVEDELLLAVPLVPKHEQPSACDGDMLENLGQTQASPTDLADASPFAVLRGLKRE